jgi:hypothetical protein
MKMKFLTLRKTFLKIHILKLAAFDIAKNLWPDSATGMQHHKKRYKNRIFPTKNFK